MPAAPAISSFKHSLRTAPLRERAGVVALVVALHAGLAWAWMQLPGQPAIVLSEMSASFAAVQMQRHDVVPQPQAKRSKAELSKERPSEPASTEQPTAQEASPSASPPSQAALDAEPDYHADYLNNPRPPYPMVARRMGYQGKVVLNVEVLAEGRAGQVLLQSSSGHQVLDNAAIQTVQGWRFTPARRFGQPVTRWFMVPVKFSLEGNEA